MTTITQFSLLVMALLFATSASAQTEFLDPGFGTVGRHALTLPALDQVSDLMVQPDGKILASGRSLEGEQFRPSLVRYLPDGSLDSNFGLNGKNHLLLPEDFNGSADVMALQSNGNIVVISKYSGVLWQYQPNGYPDPSFQYSSGSTIKYYYDLAIGADDEILLSGHELDNNGERFLISRLLPNGAKDLAFGIDGEVSLELGIYERASGVAVQPDGKIVVVGTYTSASPSTKHLIILRLNVNGTLDDSFGTNGTIELNPDAYNASNILLQPDGKILLARDYSSFISLFRFNPDGTPDSTFGTNGEARADDFSNADEITQDPSGNSYVRCNWALGGSILKFTPAGILDSAFMGTGVLHTGRYFSCLAVQANSALVAAATIADDFALARFLPNGALDSTFNGGALVRTSIGQSGGTFRALAVQPDGKIVAAGNNNGNWPALARFEADGVPDADFIYQEKFFRNVNGNIYGLVLQQDGKILAGGQYYDEEDSYGFLYRMLPDGTLDSSFYANNWVTSVNSLTLQPDGKILTAGVGYAYPNQVHSSLARYKVDGSLDPSFGNAGIVSTYPCRCPQMALQTDGNILVAGFTNVADTVAHRYRSDGSPDSTFGVNGVIQAHVSEFLKLLPDGKFLMAGNNTSGGFEIYRYLPDGNPDMDFGIAGKKLLMLNAGGIIHAMEVLSDGKILLAGEATANAWGETDYLLARLMPDASLDTSVGVGGLITTNFEDGLGSFDHAYALVIQPDGKIVLAGSSGIFTDTTFYTTFSIARYRADLTVESKEAYSVNRTPALQLTPNPASDFLQILVNDAAKWDISFYDSQGSSIFQQQISGSQLISVKNWPSGIYVLQAVSGKQVFSTKIVKQ